MHYKHKFVERFGTLLHSELIDSFTEQEIWDRAHVFGREIREQWPMLIPELLAQLDLMITSNELDPTFVQMAIKSTNTDWLADDYHEEMLWKVISEIRKTITESILVK